jgi:sodium transport system permease protein
MVLPMLLIISLLMGTMYPAIDTTAGEKERGTLETLLTLPVTNREIIIGKFFTVAVIGIVSALLNLLSMALMGVYMIKLIGGLGITTGGKTGKVPPGYSSNDTCGSCILAFYKRDNYVYSRICEVV